MWNKGAAGGLAATRAVEAALPFALLGFLRERQKPVACTRSRPYHSDDNAHVEQKNWMWPRQLLGDGRLEQEALVEPVSALYRDVGGPLMNFRGARGSGAA